MQALFRRHPGHRVGSRVSRATSVLLEELDKARQGIRTPVEDQVFGRSRSSCRDLGIRRDVRRVDDRHIQPGLDRVIEENALSSCARRVEAKRYVADPQGRAHTGQGALSMADSIDGFDRRGRKLGVTGRQRKGQRVEDQVFRAESIVLDRDSMMRCATSTLRAAVFAIPILVDRQRQDGRACAASARTRIDLGTAGFSRLMELTGAARKELQGRLRVTSASVVSITSGTSRSRASFLTSGPSFPLRRAFGQRHADIERMGAPLHLLTATVQDAVVIIGSSSSFDLAAALALQRSPTSMGGGSWAIEIARGSERASLPGGWPVRLAPPTEVGRPAACRCSGVVPQQPPTTLTLNSSTNSAIWTA